ncbi:MAG: isoleucine patch superfamily enzyme carbonic anhydrase/acetyltransferase [Nitrospirae bacterium]|nr:isoleucine patch superfamily enzyme carbonic anhydrase/acetyltransferase [Nitrospirota bacterium]
MLYKFDGKRPVFGKDTYISETAIVIGDVKIGDNCYIGHGAILRGDYGSIEIGSGTAVEEAVVIHAPPQKLCKIGERVTIGHGAIIHAASIGDLSVIGMGAVLSIYSEIGTNTIVAEGAVVKMRQVIHEDVVVGGNPARIIRKIATRDIEYWKMGKELYINLAKKYISLGMKRMG